eukprot:tig00001299_g8079.t1
MEARVRAQASPKELIVALQEAGVKSGRALALLQELAQFSVCTVPLDVLVPLLDVDDKKTLRYVHFLLRKLQTFDRARAAQALERDLASPSVGRRASALRTLAKMAPAQTPAHAFAALAARAPDEAAAKKKGGLFGKKAAGPPAEPLTAAALSALRVALEASRRGEEEAAVDLRGFLPVVAAALRSADGLAARHAAALACELARADPRAAAEPLLRALPPLAPEAEPAAAPAAGDKEKESSSRRSLAPPPPAGAAGDTLARVYIAKLAGHLTGRRCWRRRGARGAAAGRAGDAFGVLAALAGDREERVFLEAAEALGRAHGCPLWMPLDERGSPHPTLARIVYRLHNALQGVPFGGGGRPSALRAAPLRHAACRTVASLARSYLAADAAARLQALRAAVWMAHSAGPPAERAAGALREEILTGILPAEALEELLNAVCERCREGASAAPHFAPVYLDFFVRAPERFSADRMTASWGTQLVEHAWALAGAAPGPVEAAFGPGAPPAEEARAGKRLAALAAALEDAARDAAAAPEERNAAAAALGRLAVFAPEPLQRALFPALRATALMGRPRPRPARRRPRPDAPPLRAEAAAVDAAYRAVEHALRSRERLAGCCGSTGASSSASAPPRRPAGLPAPRAPSELIVRRARDAAGLPHPAPPAPPRPGPRPPSSFASAFRPRSPRPALPAKPAPAPAPPLLHRRGRPAPAAAAPASPAAAGAAAAGAAASPRRRSRRRRPEAARAGAPRSRAGPRPAAGPQPVPRPAPLTAPPARARPSPPPRPRLPPPPRPAPQSPQPQPEPEAGARVQAPPEGGPEGASPPRGALPRGASGAGAPEGSSRSLTAETSTRTIASDASSAADAHGGRPAVLLGPPTPAPPATPPPPPPPTRAAPAATRRRARARRRRGGGGGVAGRPVVRQFAASPTGAGAGPAAAGAPAGEPAEETPLEAFDAADGDGDGDGGGGDDDD